ncbi:hypothetical protein H4R34_003695 [Dimargaris verticillata]|uniref:Carbonic anhydrase n=1 Tax=Dimargaris verticillata TaxID=2761393 RepID=A0A9W8E7Z3_9FUNG|nr:hypothetical protein H4R34_003695 [Dimargaris verticillata]
MRGIFCVAIATLLATAALSSTIAPAAPDEGLVEYNTDTTNQLIYGNNQWSVSIKSANNTLVEKLTTSQKPNYLWIGCADSRVPPSTITGTTIGDIFVVRNIANVVDEHDLSMMSVIEYALLHLKVTHIIVAGHLNCGGIQSAINMTLENVNYLRPYLNTIEALTRNNPDHFPSSSSMSNSAAMLNKLTQFNVVRSLRIIKKTKVYQKALELNPNLKLEGWLYDVRTLWLNRFDDTHTSFEGVDFS